MLTSVLTWITLCIVFVGGFLDLDELKNIYYGIDISDTPLLHPSELPSDAVILSSKYGQLYQCTYPPVLSQANSKENTSQANNVSVAQLLSPMKQLPCLFSNKGWWTYEFCHGREVKQYHSEDGKIVGDVIILGIYDIRNDVLNDSEKVGDKRRKSVDRYHRQFYVNGTLCDLTGRPRETEVRFVCQEGHGDFVSSIEERETCSYVVIVHTSRICAHPSYGPPATVTSLPISCNPLLSAADYEMYMNEFHAGVANKHGSATAEGGPDKKAESASAVKKLLIESMLKSIHVALKQEDEDQHDSDSTEVSSEATLPGRETDDPSSEPSADDNVVDKPADETKEAESDASPGVADKDAVDGSARASDMESDGGHGDSDETDTKTSADNDDDDDDYADDSRVDDDEDDNEDYVKEFEAEMKDIASTSVERAHLAKYKDSIASAMQAQFSNILHEAQADMARQGEEAVAVDRDDAFKNLAKTLNLLLERLEKIKTDEKPVDDNSAGRDSATETSVSGRTDEHEATETTGDDGRESSLDDAGDSIPEKQLREQGSSDSETPQASDKVASRGDDSVVESNKVADEGDDIIVEKEVPPAKETIRDQLEKAGVRTNAERKLDLKIISTGNTEYASVEVFSDDDGSPPSRIFIAIIGDDEEAVKEQERNQRLEDNYRFKWNKNENDQR